MIFQPPRSPRMAASALFVDQTAQLGGAELCMKDILISRHHPGDRVVLFQDGPLVAALAASQIKVTVCELSSRGAAIRKSSGLVRKATALLDVGRLARRIARHAAQVDVIYANTAKALVVSAIAGKIAGKPVVYHLHDILSPDHFSRSNRQLLIQLAKRCTRHIVANSRATADVLIDAGVTSEKISVVHNGIDPVPAQAALDAAARHRREIRQALGLGDQPVIALFGRLAEWKGQHVALKALEQLPGAELLLVGDALFGEDDYVDQLTRIACSDKLRGRVHFLGFRDDVPAVMQAADVVVHCSTSPEPFGRVIVEAMLSRRPVVASNAGGAAEIIRHGETGLLFQPGSASDLASEVNKILCQQIDSSAMVTAAAKDARMRFDLAARVDDVSATLNRVTVGA